MNKNRNIKIIIPTKRADHPVDMKRVEAQKH